MALFGDKVADVGLSGLITGTRRTVDPQRSVEIMDSLMAEPQQQEQLQETPDLEQMNPEQFQQYMVDDLRSILGRENDAARTHGVYDEKSGTYVEGDPEGHWFDPVISSLDFLSQPFYGMRNAQLNFIKTMQGDEDAKYGLGGMLDSYFDGFSWDASKRKRVYADDILKELGVPDMGTVELPVLGEVSLRGVLGFAIDMFDPTDPLNKLGFMGKTKKGRLAHPHQKASITKAAQIALDEFGGNVNSDNARKFAESLLSSDTTGLLKNFSEQARDGERALITLWGRSVLPNAVNVAYFDALGKALKMGENIPLIGGAFKNRTLKRAVDQIVSEAEALAVHRLHGASENFARMLKIQMELPENLKKEIPDLLEDIPHDYATDAKNWILEGFSPEEVAKKLRDKYPKYVTDLAQEGDALMNALERSVPKLRTSIGEMELGRLPGIEKHAAQLEKMGLSLDDPVRNYWMKRAQSGGSYGDGLDHHMVTRIGSDIHKEWNKTAKEYTDMWLDANYEFGFEEVPENIMARHHAEVEAAIKQGYKVKYDVLMEHPNAAPHRLMRDDWIEAKRNIGELVEDPNIHKLEVDQAIGRGEFIPPDVMLDYPELYHAARHGEVPLNAELVRELIIDSTKRAGGNITIYEANTVAQIMDARAIRWAQQTGGKYGEWYKKYLAGIESGQGLKKGKSALRFSDPVEEFWATAGEGLADARRTPHGEIVRGEVRRFRNAADDTRHIIFAFKTANFKTFMHELGHILRQDMFDIFEANRQHYLAEYVTKWAKAADAKEVSEIVASPVPRGGEWRDWWKRTWTNDKGNTGIHPEVRAAEEKFANAFTDWISTGVAPSKELESVFMEAAGWIKAAYGNFKSYTVFAEEIPEGMEVLFGQMFARMAEVRARVRAARGVKVKKLEYLQEATSRASEHIVREVRERAENPDTYREDLTNLEKLALARMKKNAQRLGYELGEDIEAVRLASEAREAAKGRVGGVSLVEDLEGMPNKTISYQEAQARWSERYIEENAEVVRGVDDALMNPDGTIASAEEIAVRANQIGDKVVDAPRTPAGQSSPSWDNSRMLVDVFEASTGFPFNTPLGLTKFREWYASVLDTARRQEEALVGKLSKELEREGAEITSAARARLSEDALNDVLRGEITEGIGQPGGIIAGETPILEGATLRGEAPKLSKADLARLEKSRAARLEREAEAARLQKAWDEAVEAGDVKDLEPPTVKPRVDEVVERVSEDMRDMSLYEPVRAYELKSHLNRRAVTSLNNFADKVYLVEGAGDDMIQMSDSLVRSRQAPIIGLDAIEERWATLSDASRSLTASIKRLRASKKPYIEEVNKLSKEANKVRIEQSKLYERARKKGISPAEADRLKKQAKLMDPTIKDIDAEIVDIRRAVADIDEVIHSLGVEGKSPSARAFSELVKRKAYWWRETLLDPATGKILRNKDGSAKTVLRTLAPIREMPTDIYYTYYMTKDGAIRRIVKNEAGQWQYFDGSFDVRGKYTPKGEGKIATTVRPETKQTATFRITNELASLQHHWRMVKEGIEPGNLKEIKKAMYDEWLKIAKKHNLGKRGGGGFAVPKKDKESIPQLMFERWLKDTDYHQTLTIEQARNRSFQRSYRQFMEDNPQFAMVEDPLERFIEWRSRPVTGQPKRKAEIYNLSPKNFGEKPKINMDADINTAIDNAVEYFDDLVNGIHARAAMTPAGDRLGHGSIRQQLLEAMDVKERYELISDVPGEIGKRVHSRGTKAQIAYGLSKLADHPEYGKYLKDKRSAYTLDDIIGKRGLEVDDAGYLINEGATYTIDGVDYKLLKDKGVPGPGGQRQAGIYLVPEKASSKTTRINLMDALDENGLLWVDNPYYIPPAELKGLALRIENPAEMGLNSHAYTQGSQVGKLKGPPSLTAQGRKQHRSPIEHNPASLEDVSKALELSDNQKKIVEWLDVNRRTKSGRPRIFGNKNHPAEYQDSALRKLITEQFGESLSKEEMDEVVGLYRSAQKADRTILEEADRLARNQDVHRHAAGTNAVYYRLTDESTGRAVLSDETKDMLARRADDEYRKITEDIDKAARDQELGVFDEADELVDDDIAEAIGGSYEIDQAMEGRGTAGHLDDADDVGLEFSEPDNITVEGIGQQHIDSVDEGVRSALQQAQNALRAKRNAIKGVDDIINKHAGKKFAGEAQIVTEIENAKRARQVYLAKVARGMDPRLAPKSEIDLDRREWYYDALKITQDADVTPAEAGRAVSRAYTIEFPDGTKINGFRPVHENADVERVIKFIENEMDTIADMEKNLRLLDDAVPGYLTRELSDDAKEALDRIMRTGMGDKVGRKWSLMLKSSGHRNLRGMNTSTINKMFAENDWSFFKLLSAEQERKALNAIGSVDTELKQFFDVSNPVATAWRRVARSYKVQSAAEFVDRTINLFSIPLNNGKRGFELGSITDVAEQLAKHVDAGDNVIYVDRRAVAEASRAAKTAGDDFAANVLDQAFTSAEGPMIPAHALDVGAVQKYSKTAVAHIMPREVVNELTRTYKVMNDPGALNEFVRSYREIMQTWKGMALMGPGYHTRNFVSNMWANFVAGVSPVRYADAMHLLWRNRNAKKTGTGLTGSYITRDGIEFTEEGLIQIMQEMGIMNAGQIAGELADEYMGHLAKGRLGKFNSQFTPFRWNRKVGMVIEDQARVAHFLDVLHKTSDPREAMMSVNKHLFNYNKDLPRWEKNMQNIVPFWRWTRNNIPLQIQNLVQHPGRMTRLGIAKHYLEAGEDNYLMPEKYIPKYIKDGLGIQIRRNKKTGEAEFFMLDRYITVADLSPVFKMMPFVGGTDADSAAMVAVDEAIGMLGPWKMAVEIPKNYSTFMERPIEQFKGEQERLLGMNVSKKTAHAVRGLARPIMEINKLIPGTRGEMPYSEQVGQSIFGRTYKASDKTGRRYAYSEQRSELIRLNQIRKKIMNDKEMDASLRKAQINTLNSLIEDQKQLLRTMAPGIRRRK
jgi:hypothetical protein